MSISRIEQSNFKIYSPYISASKEKDKKQEGNKPEQSEDTVTISADSWQKLKGSNEEGERRIKA